MKHAPIHAKFIYQCKHVCTKKTFAERTYYFRIVAKHCIGVINSICFIFLKVQAKLHIITDWHTVGSFTNSRYPDRMHSVHSAYSYRPNFYIHCRLLHERHWHKTPPVSHCFSHTSASLSVAFCVPLFNQTSDLLNNLRYCFAIRFYHVITWIRRQVQPIE